MFTQLARLFQTSASARKSRSHRARLEVMRLEERTTPAIFTVNTAADHGDDDDPRTMSLREATTSALSNDEADTINFMPYDMKTARGLLEGARIGLNSVLPEIAKDNIRIENAIPGLTITRASDAPAFRIFAVASSASVSIINLTISGGDARDGTGGGIRNFGVLTVEECILEYNSARYGGAISNDDGRALLTVINCDIRYNTASIDGGGIFNQGQGATLTKSRFLHNFAIDGGAYATTRGNTSIEGGLFEDNDASRYGGGIFVGDRAGLTMRGNRPEEEGVIFNNHAQREGGGVFVRTSGQVEIVGVAITENRGDDYGGGLAVRRGIVNIPGCLIRGNRSSAHPLTNGMAYESGLRPVANGNTTVEDDDNEYY